MAFLLQRHPGRSAAEIRDRLGSSQITNAFYVYILATRKDAPLYVGMTSDLQKRVFEHKSHAIPGFTARYNVDRLVYFEVLEDPLIAIAREK